MAEGIAESVAGSDAQFFHKDRRDALIAARVRAGYDDPPSRQRIYLNPHPRGGNITTCQPNGGGDHHDGGASATLSSNTTAHQKDPDGCYLKGKTERRAVPIVRAADWSCPNGLRSFLWPPDALEHNREPLPAAFCVHPILGSLATCEGIVFPGVSFVDSEQEVARFQAGVVSRGTWYHSPHHRHPALPQWLHHGIANVPTDADPSANGHRVRRHLDSTLSLGRGSGRHHDGGDRYSRSPKSEATQSTRSRRRFRRWTRCI